MSSFILLTMSTSGRMLLLFGCRAANWCGGALLECRCSAGVLVSGESEGSTSFENWILRFGWDLFVGRFLFYPMGSTEN